MFYRNLENTCEQDKTDLSLWSHFNFFDTYLKNENPSIDNYESIKFRAENDTQPLTIAIYKKTINISFKNFRD